MGAFRVKGRTEIERDILELDLKGYGDHLDRGNGGEGSIKADIKLSSYGDTGNVLKTNVCRR